MFHPPPFFGVLSKVVISLSKQECIVYKMKIGDIIFDSWPFPLFFSGSGRITLNHLTARLKKLIVT